MTIQWLGHACFRIESGGYAIVLDPYGDGTVPGLSPLNVTADEVLCSHGHHDHAATEVVRLRKTAGPSPFTVTRVLTAHDDCGGEKRGMNTVHVVEAKGLRAAHLGDLGHPLTETQVKDLGVVDVLMIPVGGLYTIDAAQAKETADAVGATVVVPMHYRSDRFGFPVIGLLEEYTRRCDDVRIMPGDTVEIVKGVPKQTLVLQYMG